MATSEEVNELAEVIDELVKANLGCVLVTLVLRGEDGTQHVASTLEAAELRVQLRELLERAEAES